jgi:hypothetical protein
MARRVAVVVLLGVALGGCAVGKDFARTPAAALLLGKTTYQDIVSRMGRPQKEDTITRNNVVLHSATYHFLAGPQERGQLFFFLNNVLVGHAFSSTFPQDSTNFDERSVNQIRKGETTETDVIKVLGTPSGGFIYPYIADKEARGLGWLYAPPYLDEASRTLKMVVVSVGPNGIVTDVEVRVRAPR